MMRVIVEIHPGGDSKRARRMVVMDIANMTELSAVSDYSTIAVLNPGQRDEQTVRDKVAKHDRARGWATLVRRCLEPLEKLTTMAAWQSALSESKERTGE